MVRSQVELFKKMQRGVTKAPLAMNNFVEFVKIREKSLENINFLSWIEHYKRDFKNLGCGKKALCPPISELKLALITSPGKSFYPEVQSQPLYEETRMFIKEFIDRESNNELNITCSMRKNIIKNLQFTIHPSAFAELEEEMLSLIVYSSFQTFLKEASQNASDELLNYGLGSLAMIFYITTIISLSLTIVSKMHYYYRLISALFFNLAVFETGQVLSRICMICFFLDIRNPNMPGEVSTNYFVKNLDPHLRLIQRKKFIIIFEISLITGFAFTLAVLSIN